MSHSSTLLSTYHQLGYSFLHVSLNCAEVPFMHPCVMVPSKVQHQVNKLFIKSFGF